MALSRFRAPLAAGLAIVFTAALLVSLVTYIQRDERPLTYDDAYYLETSLRLYHRLVNNGLADFLAGYTEAFGIRAPLIAVLPGPFLWALGPVLDSALLINAVFLAVINLYLCRLAARWYGAPAGVLAVAVFQTMPVAIGMSRAFMAEYGLAALSICFLYYLVCSERLSNGMANLKLGIVGGLGMLMKINFLFVLAPFAAVLYFRRRDGPPESGEPAAFVPRIFTRSPVAAILAVVAVVSGSWYAFNFVRIVGFTLRVSVGAIVHYQAASRLIWLRDFVQYAISTYYAAALILAGAAALWVAVRGFRLTWGEREALLTSWFLPGFVAAFVGSHGDFRYTLIVLPPLAIALAASVTFLCERLIASQALRIAAMTAFLAFPGVQYAALTVNMPSLPGTVYSGGWLVLSKHLGWAHPPDNQGDWGQMRIVEAARTMVPAGAAPVNVIVGVEHPYFNANILNYLDAYDDGPLRFHSFGFDPDSPPSQAVENALIRIRGLDPGAIVMAEGFQSEDLQGFINRVNEPIREMLDSGELPFSRAGEIELTPRVKAVLYRRNNDGS